MSATVSANFHFKIFIFLMKKFFKKNFLDFIYLEKSHKKIAKIFFKVIFYRFIYNGKFRTSRNGTSMRGIGKKTGQINGKKFLI